jgi:hypothetical protein
VRKIFLGLIITGFALVLFITVKAQTANLIVNPERPATSIDEEMLILKPADCFSLAQGGSKPALTVTNTFSDTIRFSLAQEHENLIFRPRVYHLPSGSSKEVYLQADTDCPTGEILLPVYLRAEIGDERLGMEAVLCIEIIPGELDLKWQDQGLKVYLNDEPAPGGVSVSYRIPDEEEWKHWGKTPSVEPPGDLASGKHRFEFKAELGSVESEVKSLAISIAASEGRPAAEEPVAVSPPKVSKPKVEPAPAKAAPAPKPQPEPPKPEPSEPSEPVLTGYTAYRLDLSQGLKSGKYYFSNFSISTSGNSLLMPDNAYVYINFNSDGLGQYFDWSANVPIREVLVGGGQSYKSYYYNNPAAGDYYLHAPARAGSQLYHDIRYITFYY